MLRFAFTERCGISIPITRNVKIVYICTIRLENCSQLRSRSISCSPFLSLSLVPPPRLYLSGRYVKSVSFYHIIKTTLFFVLCARQLTATGESE